MTHLSRHNRTDRLISQSQISWILSLHCRWPINDLAIRGLSYKSPCAFPGSLCLYHFRQLFFIVIKTVDANFWSVRLSPGHPQDAPKTPAKYPKTHQNTFNYLYNSFIQTEKKQNGLLFQMHYFKIFLSNKLSHTIQTHRHINICNIIFLIDKIMLQYWSVTYWPRDSYIGQTKQGF